MAFNIFDDSGQGTYLILLIVGTLISIVAIVLRFVATLRSHRKPGLEDWLALSALAVFLPRVGVGCNGSSARSACVLARTYHTLAMLTVVYVFIALRYINGRGVELALDRIAYEKAFKVCSTPPHNSPSSRSDLRQMPR